jgi:deoxyribodipyrimidine photo-lyase
MAYSQSTTSVIDQHTSVFWFRRDLRLTDNTGLYHALKESHNVIGVFIFDTVILRQLEDQHDKRVEFIHQSLQLLKLDLEKLGSSLIVLHGDPIRIFEKLSPKAVYTNNDYEPYAIARDGQVAKILAGKGIEFKSFKDQVIFERGEVMKDDGKPYTIFTPYGKKWKSKLTAARIKSYSTDEYFDAFKRVEPMRFPTLEDIGFKKTGATFPQGIISHAIIANYDKQRNFPGIAGTTQLGVHLRFGTVSIRKLVQVAVKKNQTWLNELIWREFYQTILWHFPHADKAFKRGFDRIEWRNDSKEFKAWCEGRTGYPIVDAGMRELNETGFMHNRVRMIAASFLVKHLLIDWRWGEAYFAEKLLDYDLAANNGNWQWAAGSGCDAAPYFRVFNPELQTEKFDPEKTYIRKWVPEFESKDYAKRIVEHRLARERALRAFSNALG